MADFRYRTDLNPDHYSFRRSLPGWYPDKQRDTHEDKLGDLVVLIVTVLVVILFLAGFVT